MKKLSTLMGLLVLILALGLFSGCGEKTDSGETAAETEVVKHDCAGGCGMTAVPADKMVEVDGKWYCAGCKDKATKPAEGHDHEHKEGDGHDHDHG